VLVVCFREDLFAFAPAQEVDRVYGAVVTDEADKVLIKRRLGRRLGLSSVSRNLAEANPRTRVI
jgi:hypothetical protein